MWMLHVAPIVAKRDTAFPWNVELLVGDSAFRSLIVFIRPPNCAIHNNQMWLVPTCHCGNARHVDILIVLLAYPTPVKPKYIYMAIAAHEFLNLIISELLKLLPSPGVQVYGIIHIAPFGTIYVPPVILRVPVGF